MSSLARSAAWYGRHGWRVFPCIPGRKEPAIKSWPKLATTDLKQIEAWWRLRPNSNVGCACGPGAGLFVIDIDRHGVDGEAAFAELEAELGELPRTLEQRTGSGGRQLFFAYPLDRVLRNKGGSAHRPTHGGNEFRLPAGVDTRGDGGFVVVPPSIHPCGDIYRWITGPHQGEPKELPAGWIKALERRPPAPTISVPVRPLRNAGDTQDVAPLINFVTAQAADGGNRNNALYWATRKVERLRRLGLVSGSRDSELLAAALATGLQRHEAAATIASAKRAESGR